MSRADKTVVEKPQVELNMGTDCADVLQSV